MGETAKAREPHACLWAALVRALSHGGPPVLIFKALNLKS